MQTAKVGVQSKCPECGNTLIFDHQNGEVVCSSCGMVVDQQPSLSLGQYQYYRQPVHELIWNKNLGSDEKQVLRVLKRSLGLNISSDVLRVDDSHIVKGLTLLTRKLINHNLTYAETLEIAREARRRLKKLVTNKLVEQTVETVYREYFPEKPYMACRICGRKTLCCEIGCSIKRIPDETCMDCEERLCQKHYFEKFKPSTSPS